MEKGTRLFWVVALIGCVAFFSAPNSYGIIKLNYSQLCFVQNARSEMSACIEKGASNYLLSYSYVLRFFNRIEAGNGQDGDYRNLSGDIQKAVKTMQAAHFYYDRLFRVAMQTPYDPIMIDAVRQFNFSVFREPRSFDNGIFVAVKSYLQNGDVKGMYQYMAVQSDEQLKKLIAIRAQLNGEILPRPEVYWELNAALSETLSAGQYVAEIFYEIGRGSEE